ncbi:MAG TPA: hypothetical protein VFH73_08915 [Polyangia bacterium]|nr:hypothetical protein [Polyangia bacterium]
MIRGNTVAALVWIAVAAAVQPVARAEDAAVVDKLVAMNKKALDDYDTLEWDAAKKTLLEALTIGKRAGLETHPVIARTYVHLGAVYITGFKDRGKGVQAFARALEIDPTIKLSKSMATAELNDGFAQAARDAKSKTAAAPPPAKKPVAEEAPVKKAPTADEAPAKKTPVSEEAPARKAPAGEEAPRKRAPALENEAGEAPPPPPRRVIADEGDDSGEPDLPVRINALDCPAADETPPDKSVAVRCAVAPNLGVSKVFLFFREPGKEDFSSAQMEKTRKGWFIGKIPKRVVKGKSLQYYFEGRDKSGKPLVSNGRNDSPNLMLIREGAAEDVEALSGGNKEADSDENPLEHREDTGPRMLLGKIDRSKVGVDTRYGKRSWWIGIAGGSGMGYAKGNGPEARPDLKSLFVPGAGWAGLGQLVPEVGYQFSPDVAVSIQGRHQYIPQPKQYAPYTASGANSILARLLVFTKQKRARLYGAVMAGGGEGFRLVLYPDPIRPTFKDTVRGGPIVLGVGVGFLFEISKALSFVTEVNGLGGLPSISGVVDLNLGVQFNIY